MSCSFLGLIPGFVNAPQRRTRVLAQKRRAGARLAANSRRRALESRCRRRVLFSSNAIATLRVSRLLGFLPLALLFFVLHSVLCKRINQREVSRCRESVKLD